MTRADTRHLPGLDGLRAYLLFVILLFHCSVPGFSGGWIAVDVFFGLSGFLITRNLVGELERTGRVSLRGFWAGRSRRLLPALGTLLGTTLACVAIGALALTPTAAWGAVTYTTNWLHILVPGNGYWDAYAAPDPFEHLWSLAVEEQFYLVWPLVVLAVRRRGRRAVAIAAVVLALGSLATQVVGAQSGWSIDRLYQGTDTRALPFLLGALLAAVGLPVVGRRLSAIIAIAGLVVLGWSVHSLDGSLTSVYLGPLQAVSFAGIAIVATAARTEGAFLCHPMLRAIGRWSYGIYLFHWPIAVLLPSTWGWMARLTIVTVVSTVLAAITYRFIETPIRSRTWNGRRLIPASVSLAGVAIGAVIVAAPVAPGGAIARATNAVDWTDLTSTVEANDQTGTTDPVELVPAGVGGDAAAGSRPAALRTPERVLVIGDSTANVLAHGLESTGRFEIVDGGMWGCPIIGVAEVRPLVGVERSTGYCPSLDDQIAAVDLVRPDVVVIIASATEAWDQKYSASQDAPWASPGDVAWRAAHDAHMASLVSAHPDVPVVIVPAPSWRPPSMDALESPERRDAWNEQIQRWVQAHEQMATMEYVRYLPEPGSDLDREMRPDGAHLTDTAIETLSREHLADDLVTAYRSVLSRMTSPR